MVWFSTLPIKERAALASTIASGLMTLAKLVVGLSTGSIGILSEAAHSGLDLGATLITFFAVRVSDKPADDHHPYGHGKIESIAALSETGLLLATSFWIVWEAVHRLLDTVPPPETGWWSIGVITGSILIDITRATALKKIAKATRSEALAADALHFSSDILSSTAVLIGLGFVALGYPEADALAAIAVALFVCYAGWEMGRRTIDTLIDRAPDGISSQVANILSRLPGIVELGRVRARPGGSTIHIDAEFGVSRTLSLDRVNELRGLAADQIQAAIPEAEVNIATYALALDNETIRERVMMVAAYHGFAIHHVTVQSLDRLLSISLDIEVDGHLPLSRAHEIASALEVALKAEFGDLTEIETHIEPLLPNAVHGHDCAASLLDAVYRTLQDLKSDLPVIHNVHNVRVRQGKMGLFVSFHCCFSPELSVDDVHTALSQLETRLRAHFPEAKRIVSHAEPINADTDL